MIGNHRLLSIVGAVLIAAAAAWHFFLAPRWTQRVPPGWSLTMAYAGVQTYSDPATGKLPPRDELNDYLRTIRVVDERGRPDSVRIEHTLRTLDPVTKKITYDYTTTELVDPGTGERLEPQHRGQIALFPRESRKQTYHYQSNYFKGLPLAFEREERVAGLLTYRYSYRGRAEYTESYAGTVNFPGVKIPPGQEIRCADDQFYLRFWVEPHTGSIVKVEEGCPSGDYFYDVARNQQGAAVDRWSGQSAGSPMLERVAAVQRQRLGYLAARWYVPGMLLLFGAIALATSFLAGRRRA